MTFIEFFSSTPWAFYGLVIFTGLAVGSFLNVVIYRLPIMMERDWREQCHEFLELEQTQENEPQHFSLAFPASACPHCGHKIRFWENIPVISYLLLKGRCSGCKQGISPEYPLVEAATAAVSVVVAMHFGVSLQMLLALVFSWSLIALTMIDFHKQLLPDSITYPLLWLGILVNMFNQYTDLETSVIGAMAGYLSLWCVYQLFKLVTGKEGMGFGDFKLLAALGAWMGWQMLPLIILLSSVVGAVIGIGLIVLAGRERSKAIPFGPYLAIAGWIALIWGDQITRMWTGPF